MDRAILLTTHVMEEAERCDRVVLLRDGHFVAQGSPEAFKSQFHVTTVEEAFIQAGDYDEN